MKIPQHVAIILDGNGRWAAARNKPRAYGHKAGAENVEVICRAADALGIKYLTMYAFSTENWTRPEHEVKILMRLITEYMKYCEKNAVKDHMRIRVIGDRSILPKELLAAITSAEETTKEFTGLQLTIAVNYGGRAELIRAVKKFGEAGRLEELTEDSLQPYLDTADLPDPDLCIRTSGEMRLSNFMMWQLAYAELYFTDVHWPDFSPEELKKAVEEYDRRDRRYGGV
ncbi:MAG: isoprenyl transferase [Lachnospiraceae bacterium]|nr:isoprenyl transferase [Lachnospiraceae bacterium]